MLRSYGTKQGLSLMGKPWVTLFLEMKITSPAEKADLLKSLKVDLLSQKEYTLWNLQILNILLPHLKREKTEYMLQLKRVYVDTMKHFYLT